MDRRHFLTALFCATGAAVALTSAPAEAMALLTPPVEPLDANAAVAAVARDADMAEAKVDEAYWAWHRRHHRRRYYFRHRRYRIYRRRRYCRYYRNYWGRVFRRCY